MRDSVFDTEPRIAYLYDELGASDVTEWLQAIESEEASGAIARATATEVVYKIACLETGDPNQPPPSDDEPDTGEQNLRVFRGSRVPLYATPAYWYRSVLVGNSRRTTSDQRS